MEICGIHIFPSVSDLHLCNLRSVFLAPRNDSFRSVLTSNSYYTCTRPSYLALFAGVQQFCRDFEFETITAQDTSIAL